MEQVAIRFLVDFTWDHQILPFGLANSSFSQDCLAGPLRSSAPHAFAARLPVDW